MQSIEPKEKEVGEKSDTPPFTDPLQRNNYFNPLPNTSNKSENWLSRLRSVFSSKEKNRQIKDKDLNLLDHISTLLGSSDVTQKEVIETIKQLVNLHRTTENTSARKRLESWAKRVIVLYLLAVLLFICCASIDNGFLKVSDSVIITILSTTTINILGLGFIILKGHFPQNNKDDD